MKCLRMRGSIAGVSTFALLTAAAYACSTSSSSSTPGGGASASLDAAPNCAPPDGTAGTANLDGGPATCAYPGEPTPGVADEHCRVDGGMLMTQSTSQSACCVGGDGGVGCPYADTMFGQEGDDDDCKYHVTWSSSPICEGSGGVEFTVKATVLTADGSIGAPVTGAHIHPEVFTTTRTDAGLEAGCDDMSTHESPSTFEVLGEGPPGTYTGRIVFDQPGQWTVRFHLFENCLDVLPNSPHGHAAFHITVP
jgi:hypothetical protein